MSEETENDPLSEKIKFIKNKIKELEYTIEINEVEGNTKPNRSLRNTIFKYYQILQEAILEKNQ